MINIEDQNILNYLPSGNEDLSRLKYLCSFWINQYMGLMKNLIDMKKEIDSLRGKRKRNFERRKR